MIQIKIKAAESLWGVYTHTGILLNKIISKNGLFNSFINHANNYKLRKGQII